MMKTVERNHMGLLCQITGNQSRQKEYGVWETRATEEALQTKGMQSASKYIGCREATVAQWVTMCPLLEVYVREISYEGGGRKICPWWRQVLAE